MGLLDGIAGAGAFALVNKLINDHGGIQGVVGTLQQKGLAGAVESWVGTGANQAISPSQMQQALGQEKINELAKSAYLTPEQVSQQLAQHLPTVVDKMTPAGNLPQGNTLLQGGMEAFKKLLG